MCQNVSGLYHLIINELKALEGLPLSSREIDALSKSRRFSGYWEQKWISKLAAENGCDISAFSPDYGTRMGVLDEVEAAISQYCEKFDGIGNTPYTVLAWVSDEHLLELERRFTENYSTEQLNREQAAERIITSALSQQSVMGRGIFLRNSLENADNKLKQELFYQLSQSPGKMPPDILRIANVYSQFNEFCENEAGGMKMARDLFDRVTGERNETDAAAILQNASESGEISKRLHIDFGKCICYNASRQNSGN